MTHALNKALPHAILEEIPEDLDIFVERLLNYPAAIQSYQDALHLKLVPDMSGDPCAKWEKAGAIGNAIVRGLCKKASVETISFHEKDALYTQALKFAGILALGFSKIANGALDERYESRAFELIEKYHPRFNGVYDTLAAVYKIVLWNDKRESPPED